LGSIYIFVLIILTTVNNSLLLAGPPLAMIFKGEGESINSRCEMVLGPRNNT